MFSLLWDLWGWLVQDCIDFGIVKYVEVMLVGNLECEVMIEFSFWYWLLQECCGELLVMLDVMLQMMGGCCFDVVDILEIQYQGVFVVVLVYVVWELKDQISRLVILNDVMMIWLQLSFEVCVDQG